MATLFDDDFQSYSLGAGPPYAGGLLNAYSVPPSVANTITGIFGDAKELDQATGLGLLYPVSFSSALNNTLPVFSRLTVFQSIFIRATSASSGGCLLQFSNNKSQFAGDNVAAILAYFDGTIAIANNAASVIPLAVSDLSLRQNAWYIIRTDIVFSTSGSQVAIDCQVYVNGVLFVSYSGPTILPVSNLAGYLYINNLQLGGIGGGSFVGRVAAYDTIQAPTFWPHPGTPEARATQGVIELILSASTAVISITCPPATTGTAGTAYSSAFGVTDLTGTPPYTFAKTSGAFPPGLVLNTSTGVLSGTPTAAGTYTFAVTVTDSQGNTSDPSSCSITIGIGITCPPASTANIYTPYSSNIGVVGDTPADTFSITSGALPTGLSLNTSTGNIHGSPTVLGTFNFTVHVVDSLGNAGSKPCSITIIATRPPRLCTTL